MDLRRLLQKGKALGWSEEKIRRLALAGVGDEGAAAMIEQYMDLKVLRDGAIPFIKPEEKAVCGQLELATEPYTGVRIGLNPKDLQHLFVAGATGTGKTVLTYNLAKGIIEKGKGQVWFLDFKRDARHLINRFPSLHPLRPKDLKFNPLAPPVEGKEFTYGEKMWEILCQEEDLLSGSLGFGQELLDQLYKTGRPYPTIFDLLKLVEEKTGSGWGPRRSYRERIKTRLRSLTSHASFKDTFNCHKGFSIKKLEGENIAVELENLTTTSARFLALSLLGTVYLRRLWTNYRKQEPDLFVFMDESNQLLPSQWDYKLGTSFIDLLIERCREFGIAIIATSHDLRVTHSILSNSNLKVAMRLDEGKDIKKMSGSMGLDRDQREVIEQLQEGQAIWRKSRRWTEPFIGLIDPFSIEKQVTDEDLRSHNRDFLKNLMNSVVSREEDKKEKEPREEEKKPEISFEEGLLLNNIASFPFISLKARREKLGWGASKLSRIRKSLRDQGFIRKKRLNRGGRGGSMALLELTRKSVSYLEGKEVKVEKSRGGIIHSYWLNRLISYYKDRDQDVRKEVELEGAIADLVVVNRKGEVKAVEVEVTDPQNTLQKVDNLLDQVDQLTVVADKRTILNRLEEELADKEKVTLKKAQNMDLPHE